MAMPLSEAQDEQRHDLPLVVSSWRADASHRIEQLLNDGTDREAQMDARRRVAGLQRAEEAVRVYLEQQQGEQPRRDGPRAVVVHRNTWMRSKLVSSLEEQGFHVVGQGEDGAEALAMTLVEQPDLLLLEGLLPWVTPVDVVQDARRFTPRTVVAVQVEDTRAAEDLLQAGATTVFSRAVPPADVAEQVVRLLAEIEEERSGWAADEGADAARPQPRHSTETSSSGSRSWASA